MVGVAAIGSAANENWRNDSIRAYEAVRAAAPPYLRGRTAMALEQARAQLQQSFDARFDGFARYSVNELFVPHNCPAMCM
jgi:hypothetical protein